MTVDATPFPANDNEHIPSRSEMHPSFHTVFFALLASGSTDSMLTPGIYDITHHPLSKGKETSWRIPLPSRAQAECGAPCNLRILATGSRLHNDFSPAARLIIHSRTSLHRESMTELAQPFQSFIRSSHHILRK